MENYPLLSYIKDLRSLRLGLVFATNSIAGSALVTRLPDIKASLQLSEGQLGLALFFTPMGAMLVMPFCGFINAKFGEGRVTSIATVLMILAILPPLLAPNFWLLAAALFAFGAAMGTMDVSMNAIVAIVEKDLGRSIMSTSHGFFSLGGMVGAGIGSVLIGSGLPALAHAGLVAAVLMVGNLVFVLPYLYPQKSEAMANDGPPFALPKRPLVGLAVLGFCILLGEGAIADWSTVYLKETIRATPFLTALGFAAFSMAMATGRFMGDGLMARLGSLKVLRYGITLSLAGLVLVLVPQPWVVITGFGLTGLGYSCVVPVIFSAASKAPDVSPAQGIASVATISFLGFMVGPVTIGAVGEYLGLAAGFVLIIVLAALALVLTKWALKFLYTSTSSTR